MKRISLLLPAMATLFTLSISLPVIADSPSSSSGTTDQTSSTTTASKTDQTSTTSGTSSTDQTSGSSSMDTTKSSDATTPEVTREAETETTTARSEGESKLVQLEAQHKNTTTAQDRLKACQADSRGLTTKFASISDNAQAFQSRIDSIFAKLQAYQQTNNLTVPNWTALVTAATQAQVNSEASIAALKSLTPTIDCNSTSTAQDVATFQAIAQVTQNNLKSYLLAVRSLAQAILSLNATTNTTNPGGTN
ncbi:MAG TPA: hypothetical protein VNE40_00465 [Candidatus Dormibacteraeota bacterium]|nr:hypothetical protein [Candidatus Dormibacteraeota bacterium]